MHVREQRCCSFPQRFLEPCLACTPSECGQRSGPLLPPFTDASYVCARPEVDGIPVKASQLLHTAAYWLMLTVRDAIPKARELATAEFATLRLRLLKLAARVVETTSRIRLAFAAACPEADLIRGLPGALLPLSP